MITSVMYNLDFNQTVISFTSSVLLIQLLILLLLINSDLAKQFINLISLISALQSSSSFEKNVSKTLLTSTSSVSKLNNLFLILLIN